MKRAAGLLLFCLACLPAAWVPLRTPAGALPASREAFPGWPATFEGRPLRESPLSAVERAFTASFPGRMGRFTDGSQLIVLRWVTAPTHRVHSGAVCMQTAGFRLKPGDWRRDPDGVLWSTWSASGSDGVLAVRERCYDRAGRSWPDVSAWFWAAVTGRTDGPWWVVTVAEREGPAVREPSDTAGPPRRP